MLLKHTLLLTLGGMSDGGRRFSSPFIKYEIELKRNGRELFEMRNFGNLGIFPTIFVSITKDSLLENTTFYIMISSPNRKKDRIRLPFFNSFLPCRISKHQYKCNLQ
jgi:hypothetical protein